MMKINELNKKSVSKKLSGFTLVEILVVIVVISILATITIISYRGISQKAAEATVISDLDSASKKLKLFQVENSGFPTNLSNLTDCPNPATGNTCIKLSGSNSFGTYYSDNTNSSSQFFCLTVKGTNVTKNITNSSISADGSCPPTNLAMTSKTTNSISLSWGTVPGAVSYMLQRSSTVDFASHVDLTTTAPTTIATSSGLTSGSYYYRVNVTDASGVSGWSSILTASTQFVQTYATAGGPYSLAVPAGVTSMQIETWGGQGNDGVSAGCNTGGIGGLGGYSRGNLAVAPSGTLYVYVGAKGGGGSGGGPAGNGGGASDVRYNGTALSNRVIVAGGGGGGGEGGWDDLEVSCYSGGGGGNGGGATGGNGINGDLPGGGGGGGTQTTGYSLGLGGFGGVSYNGGGGGNGYYGGYGGAAGNGGGGGGAGSGYIGGVTGGTMSSGIWSGNGKVVITY